MTINEVQPTALALDWHRRGGTPAVPSQGRLRPLGLREVTLRPGFWQRRQDVNRSASFAHIERWLERAGWLGNFSTEPEQRRGREFADSEIYKFLEAMAWANDPALEDRYRAIVRRVAAAQHPDGYLNTHFGRPGQRPRYSDLEWGHELYCFGHLIQAAVARARTFGHDELVDVAIRAADHVCDVFGPGGIESVCGHPEIEPALVELYRVTGNARYLSQAALFVERRGHQVLADIEFGRSYFQDDIPVREASVLRGHAVRATYLAAGAVDVAVETGDTGLLAAVTRQWKATVARRTYLTGGIGSRHQDEAFGDDFMLPPDRAYSETCAGVGSIMLAWRLLLAHGDPRYADLIERTLFNVIATSPSDDGTRFFYTNTLHQRVLGTSPPADTLVPRASSTLRAPWFEVSCCPTNLARTFASLAAYIATTDDDGLQLHQYTAATVDTTLPDGRRIGVEIDTDYPVSGRIAIRVTHSPGTPWTLSLRVPQWAAGATIDGLAAARGLIQLRRDFTPGETIVLDLPVRPRLTAADPRIDAVRGSAAVERGPVVYCLESVDLPPHISLDALRLDPSITPADRDGAVVAAARLTALPDEQWPYPALPDPDRTAESLPVTLRPYHDWASRGPSTMRVWLPTT
ncbi:glycoside hydrolase family 127 protein [Actinoplanes sp. NEAU-A12]|uniref:Glycoside hydrolase family 127 protein n=1 Tax=Actinoplanes sandaracinus TaxID=3045177 RepID=A0ABT6WGJ9_9ACTN|nr:beta-L-arabinofuranosidase domain-containing protein [Actinoplanes sandaracinus]MDI6098851.1 glycoside hydrolase family 127 protein [Actinoplanes sandaracinus]